MFGTEFEACLIRVLNDTVHKSVCLFLIYLSIGSTAEFVLLVLCGDYLSCMLVSDNDISSYCHFYAT